MDKPQKEKLIYYLGMWDFALECGIEDYSVYKDDGQSLLNHAWSIRKDIKEFLNENK